jgi:uncharacterized protein
VRHLCDSNVFVALAVSGHQHHLAAREWLESLSDGDTAEFCRMTQNSFLRLVTTDVFMKPHTLTNEQAVDTLRTLLNDGRIVACLEEPLFDRGFQKFMWSGVIFLLLGSATPAP